MKRYRCARRLLAGLAFVCLWVLAVAAGPAADQDDKRGAKKDAELPSPRAEKAEATLPPNPPSLLTMPLKPIDLPSALKLANVENPDILIARQRVAEAMAQRLLAAAQALPNINAGLNIDVHVGTLQQSSGNILKVNRDALYLGLGANAVAAGTVGIPGIFYNLNISQGIFGALIVRQTVRVREFESVAVRNQMLLEVATAYVELLRAEGQRAIALQNRDEAREIARLTAAYALTGEGKQSDADRAATELSHRNDLVLEWEGRVLTSSARLAQLLNLDPSCVLAAIDGWVVPAPLVPEKTPLCELILLAINRRPELAARRAAIREATLALYNAGLLPFSPTLWAGFSAGTFGGGSNLISRPGGFNGTTGPRFDNFAPRDDTDVILFWTAQNMGLGNWAQVRLERTHVGMRNLELVRDLNRVRSEVATAYARTYTRFGQIDISERAVRTGERGYREDLKRIRDKVGLPIELLDNFRLLSQAREQYLDAISDFNRAEFELYVALGQPPADCLARPMPADVVSPPAPAPGCPPAAGLPGGASSAPARAAAPDAADKTRR